MARLAFLLAAVFAFTARGFALDPQTPAGSYFIRGWQTEGGLPSNKVRVIGRTPDGYLWVATHGGAARFDGVRFEVFNRSTLSDASPATFMGLVALAETGDGTLWLGSGEGLFSLRGGRFTHYTTVDGLPSNHVQMLTVAPDGDLVVGTDHSIAFVHQGRIVVPGGAWEKIGGPVRAYERRPDGSQIIGTDYGIWQAPPGPDAGAAEPRLLNLPGSSFNCFLDAPDGGLWIGCSLGIHWLHPDGRIETIGAAQGLTNLRVQCLLRDRDGSIWIGTGGGLFRMRGGLIEPAPYPGAFGATTIQSLFEDSDGTLWVGSWSGLFSLRNRAFASIGPAEGLSNTGVTSVMETRDGSWWIGTWTGGVFRYRGGAGVSRFELGDGNPTDHVLSFAEMPDGTVWVGGTVTAIQVGADRRTDYMLRPEAARQRERERLAANPAADFPVVFHYHAYAIAADPAGGTWIGTAGALYHFRDGKFRVIPTGLPPDTLFHSLVETTAGVLWAATSHGVLRWEAGRATTYGAADGLSTDDTLSVYRDSAGSIWATTANYGLNRFKDGRWRAYGSRQGLADDQSVSVVEDDGGVFWIGCAHGIMRLDRRQFDDLDAGRIPALHPQLFTKADGMPISECNLQGSPNVWKTRDGRLLFPTDGGLAVVDPRRVAAETAPPPVHLERMTVDGREVDLAQAKTAPPGSDEFEFRYTAISLLAPERVAFKVRLSPLDPDWRDAGNRREIRYPRLPHGRYTFQVIAANGDGIWNRQGDSYSFIVAPFFYQTAWFRCLIGLAAGGAVLGAYRWRVRRLHERAQALQRQNLALEHGIAERTRELALANTAKTEFLENISHEIRNPLNGIIGLVAMLREASLAVRERELAHSLTACAKALSRVFEQVLNFAKLEHGHVPVREMPFALGPLVEEVVALFRMTARQRGIEITVRREGDVPDRLVGDEEKIESILSNFVSNALKYAPGSPVEILVQGDAADDYGADITFNVTDRGPGIPPDEQELIFKKFVRGSRAKADRAAGAGLGLATCRVLAELLGGHIGVESEPGQGATFFLRLRLKRDRRTAPPADPAAAPAAPSEEARALVVEDQPYNQIVVRRMAEQLGFTADVAPDADAALAKLARQPYAVVLIDWELPSLKGDELARRVRAQPNGRDAIMIATTAHDSAEIQRRCFAAGMDGFALKPFDLETIARLLDEAYSRRGRLPRPSAPPLDTRVFGFVGYDDPRQAAQAAALYLEILDQELDALAAAVARGDPAESARAAHRLKSHAGLVGAVGLREACESVQREARQASAAELDGLHHEVRHQAAALRERLKSWRLANAIG